MKELLEQPEYLHLLANPWLTHALPLSAVALFIALLCRSRSAVRLALVLVVITGACVWPTVHYGELAHDRMESVADATGGDWLDIHHARADRFAWTFYAAAGIALLALLIPLRWPGSSAPLAWLALIVAAGASVAAAYIAFPAGKIRHRELRHGPPPAAELQAAQKHEEEMEHAH